MIPTSQLIDALRTRISDLRLFDRVEVTYEPDLLDALESFRMVERSVCLIVPGAEDWTHELEGDEPVLSELRQKFDLLIADRDMGSPGRTQAAIRTEDGAEAGAIPSKDRIQEELLFDDLGIAGLLVMPQSAEPITLRFDDPKARGRLAWAVELEVRSTIEH